MTNPTTTLKRPLIFFDLETTGVNPANDRIVQISVCKRMPDGTEEKKTILINPGIPIPQGSTDIHGIDDERVKNAGAFSQYAKGILAFFDGCDVAGFYSDKFDIPLLSREFKEAGLTWNLEGLNRIDVYELYREMRPRTLEYAHKDLIGSKMEGAHTADGDVKATMRVFDKIAGDAGADIQVEEWQRFRGVDFEGKFVKDVDGNICFGSWGKHPDKWITEVYKSDSSYIDWMRSANFAPDTLRVLNETIESLSK